MTKEQIQALEFAVRQQRIKNTQYKAYSEKDNFISEGKPLFTVLDFWRFSYSQLLGLSDAIAEFLVCRALGVEKAENVNYWTAYDLSYHGKRIEVKASSYIHPWNKKVSPNRTFSIAPSNNEYWNELPGQNGRAKLARQSEVYVFCLNNNQDVLNPEPLNVDHWQFYIIPTFQINEYCNRNGNPDQKKISLSVVRKMAKYTYKFGDLKKRIDEAIDMSDRYYLSL